MSTSSTPAGVTRGVPELTLWRPAALLTRRALIQFPRMPAVLAFSMLPPFIQLLLFGAIFGNLPDRFPDFPTENYYEYLAPAIVLFTTVIGIANAGIALSNDIHTRYFHKVVLAPVNMWAILLGRLAADGIRVYLQAGVILTVSMLFGARVATGLPGALVLLALATLFSIFTVGVVVANIALKTKSEQAVQAIFPVFFVLMFLTTAFMPRDAMGGDTVKTIITFNPAQYIITPMQDLMMVGWQWEGLLVAFAIIAAAMVLGIGLTRLNYRSVYK